MTEIIARWEWRTFGRRLDIPGVLSARRPSRRAQSSEIYLLSVTSRDNPKIRNELLDIKALQQVDASGLEQWRPVLKTAFPLSPEALAQLYRALRLAPPSVNGACTLESLLCIVDEDHRTWAVSADKQRDQYEIGDCAVEVSTVDFDGQRFRSLAVEGPDPREVRDTVASLGLESRENTSYIKALKHLRAGQAID